MSGFFSTLFWRISILAFVALLCRRTVLGLRLKRIGQEFVIKDDIVSTTARLELGECHSCSPYPILPFLHVHLARSYRTLSSIGEQVFIEVKRKGHKKVSVQKVGTIVNGSGNVH